MTAGNKKHLSSVAPELLTGAGASPPGRVIILVDSPRRNVMEAPFPRDTTIRIIYHQRVELPIRFCFLVFEETSAVLRTGKDANQW
jgi:hypothetical protein